MAAAHPGPVHLKANGECDVHPPTGTAIGWFPQSSWEDATIHLAPGDRVYICSDGFNEAMGADGEMFGYERITDCLTAARDLDLDTSIDRLLSEVQDWCGDSGRDDDMSVVALEIPTA